jgi:hypothetical protein
MSVAGTTGTADPRAVDDDGRDGWTGDGGPAVPADPRDPRDRRPRPAGRRWLRWLLVAAVLAGALLSPEVRHQLSLSLTHQPDPFTELYLDDAAVAHRAVAPGAPISFRFTIVNHESRDTAYPWTVTVDDGPSASAPATGIMNVADGGAATVAVTVAGPAAGHEVRVAVHLDERPETLQFLVTA